MSERDLYFISGSPPCWTIMLALEVKELSYSQRRLNNSNGEQKGAAFLSINPRGHVPVLVDGDVTVCETLAILSYLDAATRTPPLFGGTPEETARIWQAICVCDGHLRDLVGAISRPLFRGKAQEFAAQIKDAAAVVRDELKLLEAGLSSDGWLAGETLSAADLVVFPVVMQLMRAAGRDEASLLDLSLYPLPEHFPALAAWCDRMEDLPGFDNAYPPHWRRELPDS